MLKEYRKMLAVFQTPQNISNKRTRPGHFKGETTGKCSFGSSYSGIFRQVQTWSMDSGFLTHL